MKDVSIGTVRYAETILCIKSGIGALGAIIGSSVAFLALWIAWGTGKLLGYKMTRRIANALIHVKGKIFVAR